MSQQLSSSSSFTVITIEDGVSVQAQYAPNSTPSSSQIHNTWQDGDLYMRTRETDGVWSDWHRIVGERGDETDYSFGISIYKTTASASAPPSDISTWSDVPIAVTEEKPFLWSKVEKKTWNESTQQYVVESTRYIRLTGEDGNDGVSYIIESSVGSVTIAANKTSESISNVVFSFFKKEGDAQRVPYQCYCTVFRKKGSTYTMVRKYTTAGAAVTYSNDNITVANYDAIVVCIYNESSESHSDYLAEYQIPVWKHGDEPYFADIENEMDSIACDNVGHPSSVQSVNTSVSLFKGSSKLSSTIAVKDDSPSGTSYTNGVAKNGITVTWNNTTGAVDVSFSTDATVPEVKNFCIIVTSSDLGSTITKYLYFTVNGVRAAEQGAPAVLYRLVTNTNQIVKKKDGSYVPAIDTYVTCAVTKTVGSTESTPPATEYTLTYILNETGGEKTDYTDTKIKVQDVTKNVVFILRVSDVVVDRETIPLVSDGDNGTDAKDIEWVYIRTENNLQPEIYDDANYTDHNGNVYTNDNHLPRVNGNGRTDIETNSGTTTYPECTNSPKGVTDVYKYEWEIKRSKGNAVGGSRSWLPYSGTMTLHNNLAESAFIIDLDNDNDQFGTDSESKVLTDQTRRTIATLYDGAEPQTLTELTVSLKYEDETTTVPSDVASYTTDVNTGAVTITIKQNLTTAFSHTEIKARITAKCAKGEKNAMFTIRKIMGGAPGLNPIIYQLSPTQSSFSFSRGANNVLTPSARSSVINALKTEGNSTVPATAQDGLTYKWGWDESTTAVEQGKLIGTSITVTNTQASEHNQVWVELSSGDRETLAITKDGARGDDSVSYEIETSIESVTIPANASSVSCSFNAMLYRRIGQQSRSLYICYFGVYVRTGNSFVRIASGYDDGVTVSTTVVEENSAIVIFMFSSSYTDSQPLNEPYLAKYEVAVLKNGDTGREGERGKVGRFFYYAQTWSSSPSITYVVTDAQAPYFEYNGSYWVFNPPTNYPQGISMSDMGEPSSANPNWQIMTNDFKYLITEALFTNFAKLASAIFSGNWMLSQYGEPSRVITAEEKYLVYVCVMVDGQYPVSVLATLLDNEELWDEYIDYGYTDSELEKVADVCKWAVAAMPNNSDDVRYSAIQTLNNTSYQLFGVNQSDLFSVFSPNIALDFFRGKAYLNDCNVKGNLVGRVSMPFTDIKNSSIWDNYGVKTYDDYGYVRHYLFVNRMPSWNVQIEYMSGDSTPIRRLILPVITQETLGTEIKIVNACGYTITIEGRPEKSTYMSEGSYLLDGIQKSGYSNDERTIEMDDQTILKLVSVSIPTQYGKYGWIAEGEPQTIKSLN